VEAKGGGIDLDISYPEVAAAAEAMMIGISILKFLGSLSPLQRGRQGFWKKKAGKGAA
jgi:hypothetical protein